MQRVNLLYAYLQQGTLGKALLKIASAPGATESSSAGLSTTQINLSQEINLLVGDVALEGKSLFGDGTGNVGGIGSGSRDEMDLS